MRLEIGHTAGDVGALRSHAILRPDLFFLFGRHWVSLRNSQREESICELIVDLADDDFNKAYRVRQRSVAQTNDLHLGCVDNLYSRAQVNYEAAHRFRQTVGALRGSTVTR
jgi:hypothetical protein